MSVGNSLRDSLSRITLNSWLGASLAALIVGGVVVLAGLAAIGTAAFGPGVGKVQPDQELKSLIAQHDAQLKTWQDRLNGRSPFFKPEAPPRPKPVVVEPPKPIEATKVVDSGPPGAI